MLNYMKRSVLLKIFLAATLSSLGGWASADPARIDLLMIYTQAARQKAVEPKRHKPRLRHGEICQ
jgi:hypothetical protein